MKIKLSILLLLLTVVSGCIGGLTGQAGQGYKPDDAEIVSALKKALDIGAENSSAKLSESGGYYLNNAYRIMLPEEANAVINNMSKIPGGEKLVYETILRINTAAENAASKSVPVFAASIRSMTVQDGIGILAGDDDAATRYLEKTTGAELKELYRPDLKAALDEPFIAGISATQSWNTLVAHYNRLADSTAGKLAGIERVNVDLEEHVLNQALSALFKDMALEEAKIRANPFLYADETIRKVFSYAKIKL